MKAKHNRLVVTFLIAAATIASADAPDVDEDGLVRLSETELATVYADPRANLASYDRILLEEASVAFRKHWQRDQNRRDQFKVRERDMQRIREDMAELFNTVFSEALERAGYTLTDQPGPDVLHVIPAIVDLDIVAPDTHQPARVMQYSEESGEMTLNLELRDSVTGDTLVRAIDRERDYHYGYFEWRNRVTNRRDARQMMKSWASEFIDLLDKARRTAVENA